MRKSSIHSEGGIAARRRNTFHMASIIAAMLVAGMALLVSIVAPSRADDVEGFYKGHSLSMIIGFGVGGGYDLYGRLVSRYMGKYLPGKPTVVPENMAGAGSLRAVDYLYSVAPKDGSVVGTFSRTLPLAPLLSGANFDSRKFTWLGSVAQDVIVCFTSRSSPIKTWQDLLTKPSSLGGEGAGAEPDIYARFVKNIFGAKVKLVSGYPGTNDVSLALERGEIDGFCGLSWSTLKSIHTDWLQSKSINVIVQAGLHKEPDLHDVPSALDLAKTDEQRQLLKLILASQEMARPFAAPPGLPADRKAALLAAFDDTMKDDNFLAEAKKEALDINPVSAKEVDSLMAEVYATPKAITDKAAKVTTAE
jgi:tripartite-type tricarboxylate transporter receptor subunit TctC